MEMTSICRTCLSSETFKNISDLQTQHEDTCSDSDYLLSGSDIIFFCLNIKVEEDSKISTKLCLKCFEKIMSFYKFKLLALNNDAYLKTAKTEGHIKNEVYLRDNIKRKNESSWEDEADNNVFHVKLEPLSEEQENESDCQSDNELLSEIKKIKYEFVPEDSIDETKENVDSVVSMSSENDDVEMCETPPDIRDAATTVAYNLLPEKSRKQYEKYYKDFMNWKTVKKETSFSENVLLVYFQEISTKFKPCTLWTIYSMLKSTLNIKNEVDISKYCKLIAFLKRKSEGYTGKKSKTFLPEEIKKFLNEAPDKLYLMLKVALIFGTMGACRRQELYNMKYEDVKIFENTIIITVRNTKNKIDRTFTVTGNYAEICKKYIELRPKPCQIPNFFVQYIGGKCLSQKVGLNKFGSLGKTIATCLELPNPQLYTGHCFRRTSATLVIDSEADIITLKRHGGWKSTTVAEGYIDNSVQSKVEISNK